MTRGSLCNEEMNEAVKDKMMAELAASIERLTEPGALGGPNEGPWVLIGSLLKGREQEGIPVMEPRKRMVMRRYRTAEEAIAASVLHSALRVNGGWTLNLETGQTVPVRPFEGAVV